MWSIALLGRLCICRGQQEISRFRTRRTASLLGYLACYPNRAHPREELMDVFWGEASFETRRSALRVALNALRQQLEGDDIPHGEVLVADRSSVRFATSRYSTDTAMFEDLLKQAAETDENSPSHWTLLTAAADAYHGPLLPVFDETWVLSERRRLEDAYLGAVRALTRHCIQQNDADQALVFARRTLQVDPLREESHRTLMRLYAKMGRPEAVRDQFADLTRVLRDAHLGEPTPPTRELVVQLCSSKPTASHLVQAVVANAPTPSLSSISEERLRLRGEVLHVCAGAGSLYGRETELDELRMLLDDRETRLITITGTGGVGKTRLAAEALKYAPLRFADSTYGVSLADLLDPGLLCRTILRAVFKDETEACSPLDSLVTALSGRPTLLVLDNFEHLLREDLLTSAPANPPRDGVPPATSVPDARSLIRDLVDRLPQLSLLVTSRQPLDLVGERVFVVLPLSVPSRTEPLSCLRVCPSVQLFEARANDVHRASG